jgi:predicted RNA-binding Zn-ribbon protein involved in translation (DUF1610 family)
MKTVICDENDRLIQFTCPKCGRHKLLESNTDAIVDLTVKRVWIGTDENGEPQEAYVDYASDWEVVDYRDRNERFYRCASCGKDLEWIGEDGESHPVQKEYELAVWIFNNCKPQES